MKLLISESHKTSYIVIDKEKCKACYYCVSVCPREVIEISGEMNKLGYNCAKVSIKKAQECTGCKSCAIMCPDMAISVFSCRISESDT